MAAPINLMWIWIAMAALMLASCGNTAPSKLISMAIGSESFKLEPALDEASRTRGLSERESIAADGGMIFVFPEPQILSFHMYDCKVDIDIVFLDARGRVTAKYTMAKEAPRGSDERKDVEQEEIRYRNRLTKYSSRLPAVFAIELKAGSFDRLGIKVGDKIDFDAAGLKVKAR